MIICALNGALFALVARCFPPENKNVKKPRSSFADVVGCADLKRHLLKLSDLAWNPARVDNSHAYPVALLSGPHGCGKTFLVESFAGQCKAGLVRVTAAQVLNGKSWCSAAEFKIIIEELPEDRLVVVLVEDVGKLRLSQVTELIDAFRCATAPLKRYYTRPLVIFEFTGKKISPRLQELREEVYMVLEVVLPDDHQRFHLYTRFLRDRAPSVDFSKLAHLSPTFTPRDIQGIVDTAVSQTERGEDVRSVDVQRLILTRRRAIGLSEPYSFLPNDWHWIPHPVVLKLGVLIVISIIFHCGNGLKIYSKVAAS